MEKIILDKKGILEYQQNRSPYLMIDFATEIIPGKSAKGYKDLNNDEWFFKVHWPKDPNMPGMLQVEALVQMCALSILCLPGNKGKVMYLTSANNLKFIDLIKSGNYNKTTIFGILRSLQIPEITKYFYFAQSVVTYDINFRYLTFCKFYVTS